MITWQLLATLTSPYPHSAIIILHSLISLREDLITLLLLHSKFRLIIAAFLMLRHGFAASLTLTRHISPRLTPDWFWGCESNISPSNFSPAKPLHLPRRRQAGQGNCANVQLSHFAKMAEDKYFMQAFCFILSPGAQTDKNCIIWSNFSKSCATLDAGFSWWWFSTL